ncbi:hypothetical protein BDR06DRAFT_1004225 [Suillus hirtellus]|nr:hypothetical protein BDR06DRAFT_1004225 [Suillus hirtellus]
MPSSANAPMMDLDLKDITKFFEHAGSCLLAIHTELEKTKLTTSPESRQNIGQYLIWELEAWTLPWLTFCAGLSINPPLSRHLRHMVYDSLMSLPVSPCGPWTKGRLVCEYCHAWWTCLSTLKPDEKFFSTYPDSNQVRDVLTVHFEQLSEGTALIMPATSVEPMTMLITQQVATICTEAREEGQYLLKMLEDKVVKAKMVAATMLRMDMALGDDVLQAITVTDKLVKYLKWEATE